MAGDLSTDAPVYKVPCPYGLEKHVTDRALTPEVTGPGEEVSTRTSWLLWRVHLGKGNVCCRGCLHGLLEDLHGLYWWPESVASSSMKLEGLPRTMAEPEADVSLRGQLYHIMHRTSSSTGAIPVLAKGCVGGAASP